MLSCKSFQVILIYLFIHARNIQSIHGHNKAVSSRVQDEVDINEQLKHCQELRTRADRYINFFALDYFQNENSDNEIFRYKFYVKGDRDIYILFTETDTAVTGAKCLEFGISTSGSPSVASTFRTNIDGPLKVRTEETISVSGQTALPVTIFARKDGEVQLIVSNNLYPLLRFSHIKISPKFISFSTKNNILGNFYFNCNHHRLPHINPEALAIPVEHFLPVVYISFKINSLSRHSEMVTVNLGYNMTIYDMEDSPKPAAKSIVEKIFSPEKSKFRVPKLQIFSNNMGTKRDAPSYKITVDYDNKLIATADENIEMTCQMISENVLFCNLAFALEDNQFHLTYYPDGELFSSSISKFADVKVFQASNSARISSIPLKSDIEMKFKFDLLKF